MRRESAAASPLGALFARHYRVTRHPFNLPLHMGATAWLDGALLPLPQACAGAIASRAASLPNAGRRNAGGTHGAQKKCKEAACGAEDCKIGAACGCGVVAAVHGAAWCAECVRLADLAAARGAPRGAAYAEPASVHENLPVLPDCKKPWHFLLAGTRRRCGRLKTGCSCLHIMPPVAHATRISAIQRLVQFSTTCIDLLTLLRARVERAAGATAGGSCADRQRHPTAQAPCYTRGGAQEVMRA